MEESQESGMEWWQGTPGYIAYTPKHGGKKKMRRNSDLQGTEVLTFFQQCADHLGSAIGMPRVMCIMCRKVLAHPSRAGTSWMHDHNGSSACLKSRMNPYDRRTGR